MVSHNEFLVRVSHRLDALADRPEAGILVALSGGPDSVALLLAVQSWCADRGRPMAAAHLNHHLRGDDAQTDADFCQNLCDQLKIPLFHTTADPRPVARSRGQGLEEAGRHLRRAFCEDVLARDPQYGWIATGHHRDDQVETVLMRLFRGTSPGGLRGIRPRDGLWLHPFLDLTKAEIIAYLAAVEQPWRTDITNLTGDNVRARLRRELLPLVRDIFGSGCGDNPARMAALLEDDLALLDELSATWLAACAGPDDSLLVAGLAALDPVPGRRVLHRWLLAGGASQVEQVHLENIQAWLQQGTSGSTLDLPEGWRVGLDFGELRLRPPAHAAPPLRSAADYRIVVQSNPPGTTDADPGPGDPRDSATWSLTCPATALHGNLRLRNAQPGDRLHPFGLQGTKKLSDLLREHRIARDQREGVLVVDDNEGILWVVGFACAERTRMLPSSARTVTITVIKRKSTNIYEGTNSTKECP